MARMVSRQTSILKICFQSQVYVCGICGGQSGTRTGVPRTTLVFPYGCHYTNAPHLFTFLLRTNRGTVNFTLKSA